MVEKTLMFCGQWNGKSTTTAVQAEIPDGNS